MLNWKHTKQDDEWNPLKLNLNTHKLKKQGEMKVSGDHSHFIIVLGFLKGGNNGFIIVL